MKNIKNNYKIDQMYNYEKIMKIMGDSISIEDHLLIEHFSMINHQRWFIHDKLKELGYKDNWEIQKIHIDECYRIKILHFK
jgi:hypothetical protein